MEVPSKLMGAQLVPCLRFRLLRFYRSTSCCSVACAGEAQPGRCRWGVIFLDRLPPSRMLSSNQGFGGSNWQLSPLTAIITLGAAAPKLGATGTTLSCDVNLKKIFLGWNDMVVVLWGFSGIPGTVATYICGSYLAMLFGISSKRSRQGGQFLHSQLSGQVKVGRSTTWKVIVFCF